MTYKQSLTVIFFLRIIMAVSIFSTVFVFAIFLTQLA